MTASLTVTKQNPMKGPESDDHNMWKMYPHAHAMGIEEFKQRVLATSILFEQDKLQQDLDDQYPYLTQSDSGHWVGLESNNRE